MFLFMRVAVTVLGGGLAFAGSYLAMWALGVENSDRAIYSGAYGLICAAVGWLFMTRQEIDGDDGED